jgi:hypothetical protein
VKIVKKTTYYVTDEDGTEYRTDDKGETWEVRMGENWQTDEVLYEGLREKFIAEINKMCS